SRPRSWQSRRAGRALPRRHAAAGRARQDVRRIDPTLPACQSPATIFRPDSFLETHDMTDRIEIAGMRIARELHDFVVTEALPGTGVDAGSFWSGFAAILRDLAPKNRALLKKRDEIQEKLDAWYREN